MKRIDLYGVGTLIREVKADTDTLIEGVTAKLNDPVNPDESFAVSFSHVNNTYAMHIEGLDGFYYLDEKGQVIIEEDYLQRVKPFREAKIYDYPEWVPEESRANEVLTANMATIRNTLLELQHSPKKYFVDYDEYDRPEMHTSSGKTEDMSDEMWLGSEEQVRESKSSIFQEKEGRRVIITPEEIIVDWSLLEYTWATWVALSSNSSESDKQKAVQILKDCVEFGGVTLRDNINANEFRVEDEQGRSNERTIDERMPELQDVFKQITVPVEKLPEVLRNKLRSKQMSEGTQEITQVTK
ncbi:MAG: hypothetical protein FWC68_04660 [Oscillospiraceae bacterium]|nr:hypothetical protein [Oscillospiraceae bacterium]